MAEQKYYFITYAWKTRQMENYLFENDVINTNPIDEIKEMQENKGEEYKLMFYTEITKEEYEKHEGTL